MAAKTVVGFFGSNGAQGGQFATTAQGPGGAAVNLSGTGGAAAGDVYIADRGNNRIQQFHANGTWVRTFGVDVIATGKPNNLGTSAFEICDSTAATPNVPADCKKGLATGAGGMGAPQGVAIEQSTGNLYVTDQNNSRVEVFSATGAFQGTFGWNVKNPGGEEKLQLCTTGCSPGSLGAGAGQFASGIGYPSIHPANGHILVPDRGNRRVQEFAATISSGVITDISFVRAYGWGVATGAAQFEVCTTTCLTGLEGTGSGQFGLVSPSAVAADSSGRVYALDIFNKRVQAFSAALTPEGEFAAAKLSGEPFPIDLGVDPSNNHLLVTKPCSALLCPGTVVTEQRVLELDAAGNTIQTWAAKSGIPSSTGLGIGSGSAFMTTKDGGPGNKPGFFVLGDPVPPAASIDPVTTFTGTTATFEGDIHTDTIEARYHWEYSLDGSTWARVPAKSSEDKSLPGDNADHAVSVNAEGLVGLSEYQVRLVADKSYAGGSATAQTSFTTASAPPALNDVSHSHLRDTSAQLDAQVNPQNEETEYHFEYVDQVGFEAEGFTGAESAPVPPGQLDGGNVLEVHEPLSDLEPETTYRYRLLASNGTGAVESAVGSFTTYASPQAFDPCPNDNQFRINKPAAKLPDCRAYEQATPTEKNGGNVQSEFTWTKASPSGHRVSFEAVAGLPGGEGAQDFPSYFATRMGGEWSTQGMLPNGSAGQSAHVFAWTPDFAQVFSWATRFGEGTALLSRSSVDGSLATLVPHGLALFGHVGVSELGYSGASADGSTVLFNTPAQLAVAPGSPNPAAGITSGEGNLYAWDRDSGELYFAGARPDDATPAKGSVGGIAKGYRQDTHAVSSDGSVYFTDLDTGQLYRRLNPTAPETAQKDGKGNCIPNPVLACTAHVSASEKDDGGGLEGHDAAGSQATQFMAASTDGTKAIFTSSEKLTNDAYTGFEPDPAAIARADITDGGNKDLGFLPTFAEAIDVEGEYVYWTDPEHDQLGRAKLDKSLYEEDFITGLSNLKGLAVIDEPGAQYVYWTDIGEYKAGQGSIGRADLDGGNVDETCLDGLSNPRSIAASSEYIYWTIPKVAPGKTIESPAGQVGRADLTCSNASVDEEFMFTSEVTLEPRVSGDIAVDSSHIYFSSAAGIGGGSFIYLLNLDGIPAASPIIVEDITSAFEAPSIAVDGSHLYWTEPIASKVGRSDLDGTNASEEHEFITAVGHPQGLAVGSTHLYWSANQEAVPNAGNDLYSYDAEAPVGERLTDLAPENDGENGIEVQGVLGASQDASRVYFVANGIPDAGVSSSPNANGEEAETGDCKGSFGGDPSGICNLYLADEGEVVFIAQLDAKSIGAAPTSDAVNWISINERQSKTARVSADGRTLLFRSQRQLTGYDNEGPECVLATGGKQIPGPCMELYRYRVGEPGLLCVSCNPTGAAPVGNVEQLVSITTGEVSSAGPAPLLSRNLSADGNRVFFETRDALVTEDTNGDESCDIDESYRNAPPSCQDVYEWEAAGTGSCPEDAGQQGCIYLLSTGTSPHPSFFGDASLSGDDAFIFTFSQLVRQDEDDLLDVYDAKVEGGLFSQDAIPPVPCEGEACKAAASTPPVSESAGSSTFSAPGNPPAVHKKANKNKKKKKRRQARKKQQKKRHDRAAKTTRRASR